MAIDTLINCGCSFAHGYGGVQLSKKEYNEINGYGLASLKQPGYHSVGYKIAKAYNYQYVDLARNGNSNEGIFRTLQNYLFNHYKNVAVVIGWTNAFRREYVSWNVKDKKPEWIQYREIPKHQSFFSNFAKKFYGGNVGPTMVEFNERTNRPLSFSDHIELRQANIILQTQRLLDSLQIPYVMYHGCGNEQDSKHPELKTIKKQINKDKFFDYEGLAMDQWIVKKPKYQDQKTLHPSADGHEQWFTKVLPVFKKSLDKK